MCFFFSSRRRHTSSLRDWSSDVCSSDLATGGGVWKTDDGGITWSPITDGYVRTGSVGAIAVAPSDPSVIYVGMGEADIRSNFSHGDGVYKSIDAGKTWKQVGLSDSRQIR